MNHLIGKRWSKSCVSKMNILQFADKQELKKGSSQIFSVLSGHQTGHLGGCTISILTRHAAVIKLLSVAAFGRDPWQKRGRGLHVATEETLM